MGHREGWGRQLWEERPGKIVMGHGAIEARTRKLGPW